MKQDFFTRPDAKFSDDYNYRYWLGRTWDEATKPVVFVMLNPSTADAETDDHTIRRCVRYAMSWKDKNGHHYGGLEVVNLFAYRETDPLHMMQASDPIGPENDRYIIEACKHAGLVVCAWGVHGTYLHRDDEVLQLLISLGVTPHYLQLTGNGSPSHPLRLQKNLKPQPMTLHSRTTQEELL